MPKAILKGSKPGTNPLEFTKQTNGIVHIAGQASEGHKWSFTLSEKEFASQYEIVEEEKAKE